MCMEVSESLRKLLQKGKRAVLKFRLDGLSRLPGLHLVVRADTIRQIVSSYISAMNRFRPWRRFPTVADPCCEPAITHWVITRLIKACLLLSGFPLSLNQKPYEILDRINRDFIALDDTKRKGNVKLVTRVNVY